MTHEQDPSRLFPEGFYDHLQRLSIQNYSPELRADARAELERHQQHYDRQATETMQQPKRILPIFKLGMYTGSLLVALGLNNKEPDAFVVGSGLLSGSITGAILQKRVGYYRRQLSRERVGAISSLLSNTSDETVEE